MPKTAVCPYALKDVVYGKTALLTNPPFYGGRGLIAEAV